MRPFRVRVWSRVPPWSVSSSVPGESTHKSTAMLSLHRPSRGIFGDEPLSPPRSVRRGQGLRTIERIDVLWLRGRSITRAFEVEHTTSIDSGILRRADLLALQPNMDIRLHMVAPAHRREKVKEEIQRPVFSLLERGALSESCTFISYDSIRQLALRPHLSYLSDTVLDEYDKEA